MLCNNSLSKFDYSISGNKSSQSPASSRSHEGELFDSVTNDPSKCLEVFMKIKRDIQRSYVQIDNELLTEKRYAKYLRNVERIFGNSSRNLSSYKNFTKCEDHKDQMIYLDNLYYKTVQVGRNLSETLTYEEAYHHSQLLLVLFEELKPFRYKEKELYEEFKNPCDWLKDLGNEYRIKSHEIMKRYGKLKEVKDTAWLKFDFLRESWWYMEQYILKIELSIEIIKKYQHNELTKLKLLDTIQNSHLQKYVQSFTFHANKFDVSMQDYWSEMKTLKQKIKSILDDILALQLPTFKTNNLQRFEVLKSAPSTRWINMKKDTVLRSLWNGIFINLQLYGSWVRGDMTLYATKILAKVNVLTETLRKYKDSLKIDKDFLV